MHHLPCFSDAAFSLQAYDARLAQTLTPSELAIYQSLSVEGRIVVAHRLLVGDSFERARCVLHKLAGDVTCSVAHDVAR